MPLSQDVPSTIVTLGGQTPLTPVQNSSTSQTPTAGRQRVVLGANWHAEEQQSPSVVLPSSHCSPSVTMPLPQPVGVQLESQPSPSSRLPSSHCSPGSMTPSPH